MRFARRILAFISFVVLSAGAHQAAAQVAPYDGLRKTIAVDTFLAADVVGGDVTAEGMTAMLTEALVRDGRFIVVERPGLSGAQYEQDLGYSGSTSAATAAPSGQLIGASAIVRGTVTQFEAAAGGGSIGINMPLGNIFGARAGARNQRAVIEVSLRLIDTATGEVISTSSARGSASASSSDVGLVDSWTGASAGASAFRASPMGQAGQDAIGRAVDQIAAGMRGVPWSAVVVDANDSAVYVNAGADRNVQAGLTLNAYRPGAVLTDPATGMVLDVEMTRIAVIRIDEVRARLSTAVLVSGERPARGDILRLD